MFAYAIEECNIYTTSEAQHYISELLSTAYYNNMIIDNFATVK